MPQKFCAWFFHQFVTCMPWHYYESKPCLHTVMTDNSSVALSMAKISMSLNSGYMIALE